MSPKSGGPEVGPPLLSAALRSDSGVLAYVVRRWR